MKSTLYKIYISLKNNEYFILCIISFILYLVLYALLIGKYPFSENPYNTYMLQAIAWKHGHLDLGQDYPWLELAIYDGKYFCSFPPFPSYILFILSFIFGETIPEYIVVLFFDLLALISLFKISTELNCSNQDACLFSLFLMLGTNVVFIIWNPSVWFMAQIICFSMCCFSLYCALHKRTSLSLFCLAAAVGCRPMEVIFFPFLIALCAFREKKN